MGVTQDDVIEILRIMDKSRFQELHLEMGDLKIVLNKSDGRISAEEGDPASGVAVDAGGEPGSAEKTPQEITVSSHTGAERVTRR